MNNFHSLEVVDRISETQLQVGENSNLIIWRLKGFGWNIIGPASQPVAQHHISIGLMYRVIWCFWHRDRKRQPHKAAVRKHMTSQRRRLWVNIETA